MSGRVYRHSQQRRAAGAKEENIIANAETVGPHHFH
jgi:hypothetical protein